MLYCKIFISLSKLLFNTNKRPTWSNAFDWMNARFYITIRPKLWKFLREKEIKGTRFGKGTPTRWIWEYEKKNFSGNWITWELIKVATRNSNEFIKNIKSHQDIGGRELHCSSLRKVQLALSSMQEKKRIRNDNETG